MPLMVVNLVYTAIAGLMAWFLLFSFYRDLLPERAAGRLLSIWIMLTGIFFLAPTASLMMAGFLIVLLSLRNFGNKVALSAFLLPLVPAGSIAFGQMPGINYLLDLSFPFLICAVVLLPVAIKEMGKAQTKGMGFTDFAMVVFWLAMAISFFRETTLTNTLRSVIQSFILTLVPYFAFSRGLKSREDIERTTKMFVAAIVIAVCIAIVAQAVRWNWYSTHESIALDEFNRIKSRGALLRVGSTFTSAYIDYGAAVCIALLLAIPFIVGLGSIFKKVSFIILMLIGMLFAATRSPFISLIAGFVIFTLSQPKAFSRMITAGLIGSVVFVLLLLTPLGQGLVDYIPFIGASGGEADYRSLLLELGWQTIMQSPLFGDPFFLENPIMQELVQGEGIIDIVNDPLGKALRLGLPVAGLYTLAHFLPSARTFQTIRKNSKDEKHWRLVGASLSSSLFSYVIIYFTASKLSIAHEIGWLLIGLNVAYVRLTLSEVREGAVSTTQELGNSV